MDIDAGVIDDQVRLIGVEAVTEDVAAGGQVLIVADCLVKLVVDVGLLLAGGKVLATVQGAGDDAVVGRQQGGGAVTLVDVAVGKSAPG